MEFTLTLLLFFERIVPNLLIFIALVFLDVGLGIMAAIKRKEFEWKQVGDFYATNILPYLGGWLLFAAFGAFVIDRMELLGEYQFMASAGFIWFTWMFLAGALVASIGENFKELYGRDLGPIAAEQKERA